MYSPTESTVGHPAYLLEGGCQPSTGLGTVRLPESVMTNAGEETELANCTFTWFNEAYKPQDA